MPNRLLTSLPAAWLLGLLLCHGAARSAPDVEAPTNVVHYLPFPTGVEYKVWQGNDQGPSHNDKWNRYAFDFSPMRLGAAISATADGTVTYVKEDTTGPTGKGHDNNEVAIRHADGAVGVYAHLQKDGASVEVGDVVHAGDPVGRAGNTGASNGVHLHFVLKQGRRLGPSIPCRFADVPGSGVPKTGDLVTSQNVSGRRLREALDELNTLLALAVAFDAREGLVRLFKALEKGPPPTILRALEGLGQRADFVAHYEKERKAIRERFAAQGEAMWKALEGARGESPSEDAVYFGMIGKKEFSLLPRRRDFESAHKELRRQEGYSGALKLARPRLLFRDLVQRALAKDYDTLQKAAMGRKVRWKSVAHLYEKTVKKTPSEEAAAPLRDRLKRITARIGE